MKKQYNSPTFRVFNIYAENFLAMSFAIDDTQQAEQWTQHKGWNCEDWMGGDGFEEEE